MIRIAHKGIFFYLLLHVEFRFAGGPDSPILRMAWKHRQTPVGLHAVYRRENGQLETEINRKKIKSGITITSRTFRGNSVLTLTVKETRSGVLREARVSIDSDGTRRETIATYHKGHVSVRRHDQSIQEFDCPSRLICTSAPDWTDTVLLCMKYNRKKGGHQEFDALWIHPDQPAQQLRFTAERVGTDWMKLGSVWVQADRIMLTIRGGSRYVAWSVDGLMIKLTPIDRDGKLQWAQALYLDGYNVATKDLS